MKTKKLKLSGNKIRVPLTMPGSVPMPGFEPENKTAQIGWRELPGETTEPVRYWIQYCTGFESGLDWVDSIGLPVGTTQDQARASFAQYAIEQHTRPLRLVERTDKTLASK